MALAVFNEPPWADYSYTDELPVAVLRDGGPHEENRIQLAGIAVRAYTWPMQRLPAERLAIDTFFRAHKYQVTAFLVLDPKEIERERVGVSLGLATAGQTVFPLTGDLTEENYRDYPSDAHAFVVRRNAVPVTATVQRDARTFTLSVAASAGDTVDADYVAYRLVRLDGEYEWQGVTNIWYATQLRLREILRP